MKTLAPISGFVAWTMLSALANAQDRGQTRSMVISRGGIVAAESPLAARAGVRILETGGNAIDAAIATNAMMGVVEPMMDGIRRRPLRHRVRREIWQALRAQCERLGTERHKLGLREMPQQGVNSIIVPGAVDGWQKLAERFGRKKLADDLASKGHKIELHGPYATTVGGGQAVLRDFSTGVNYGASDPRKDGEAIAGLPLGPQH